MKVECSLKVSYPKLPNFSLKSMITFKDDVTKSVTNPSNNQSNVDKLGHVMTKVLRISLYQSLFPDELNDGLLRLSHGELKPSELVDVLADGLPGEVSEDAKCMQWLSMCTRRINQMQLPRYVKLHEQLNELMKVFITKENVLGCGADDDISTHDSSAQVERNTNDTNGAGAEINTNSEITTLSFVGIVDAGNHTQNERNDVDKDASGAEIKTSLKITTTADGNNIGEPIASMLELRHKYFQDHIDSLPWNVEKRESLVGEYGYAASFWWDQHQLEVIYLSIFFSFIFFIHIIHFHSYSNEVTKFL